jgi:phage-related protein
MNRQAYFYKNYFRSFYDEQTNEVKAKIDWTIDLIRQLPYIPQKYFKHIEGTNGLFEIRVDTAGNAYRIFSFFDEGNLVVITNGFIKKTQKTPKDEIKRALRIKKEYFDEKNG